VLLSFLHPESSSDNPCTKVITANLMTIFYVVKRWKHLEPVFGRQKARDVNEGAILRYSADRLREAATPATVQREISCLRRMFRLGVKHKLLTTIPAFPQVEQDGLNARQGIVEAEDFQRVCVVLPEHVRVLAIVGYWTGARKAELLALEWRHLDLTTGKVALEAGMCKNKHPRSFFLPPAALQAVRQWKRLTKEWELRHHQTVRTVFHLNGQPIKSFRGAWDRAFDVAGVPRKLFHDLQRTAITNYVNAGVPKSIARGISGHRTENVFERYNIRDDDKDKQAAALAIAQRVDGQKNGAEMGKEVSSANV
jgi:integrase